MSEGRISTVKIAVNNILHRRFRSFCIILLTAVTTVLVTGGTLLGISLRNGINSVTARLGADAMVVPRSADDSFEGALLSGSPSTFYLAADTARRIMQLDGIDKATTQLFISTFDSDHCAALVQIIGYDPTTDFVVTPWLAGSKIAEPAYGEVVTGANILIDAGEKIQFFSVNLDVVGVLDKTGMGFDNSAFVNMETAQMLLGKYGQFIGAEPLPQGLGAHDVVSAVLIDIKTDTDPAAFRRSVTWGFMDEGIRYVSPQSLLADTSKNLNLVIRVLSVLLTALWIFAVFALGIIFTLMFNERQLEFGILRAIGATRKKLIKILLSEAALLCSAGAVGGIGLMCLFVFPYNILIERALQTTYLPPRPALVALILFLGCLSGAVTGPLASIFSAARIGKNEVIANMREGR